MIVRAAPMDFACVATVLMKKTIAYSLINMLVDSWKPMVWVKCLPNFFRIQKL